MPNKRKRRKARHKRRTEKITAEGRSTDIVLVADDFELDLTAEGGEANETPRNARTRIVAYTGGRISLPNYPHPVVIDLSGVRAMSGDQLPLLRDHDPRRVVGHGRPSIGPNQLLIEGELSVPGADRDAVIEASRQAFQWQASIGGRVVDSHKNVDTIPAGRTVRVNGQTFAGPIHVVRAFLWKETSFVSLGADEGRASASIAATIFSNRGDESVNFDEWLQAQGINPDDLNDDQRDNLHAAWSALNESTSPNQGGGSVENVNQDRGAGGGVDIEAIVHQATQAAVNATRETVHRERRVDQLFASYADTSMPQAERDQLRASVLSGEISEDSAHLRLIQSGRSTGGTFNVHSGGGSSDIQAMSLEAGLARNAGFNDEGIHAILRENGASDDQAGRAVERSARDRRGLRSLILAVCRQEGQHYEDVTDDAITCAMRASQRDLIMASSSGGFSTVNLPGILSRLANKAMLEAYAETESAALRIASTTSTSDFKKYSRYRMTESGSFERVSASGELKHGQLKEETYENQVETYGKMLSLTRQMMRNDDLDAFLQIPRMIGRMARKAIEDKVFTTLIDAPTAAGAGTTEFFHGAARNGQAPNYLEGATTNLSLDSLASAHQLFLNMVDIGGTPIDINPELLLHGPVDFITARKLYNDTEYRFTASDRTETINNQWQGMFDPVLSRYLHRSGATPLSKVWFLLARPRTGLSAIEIGFLDGRQTPIINTSETSFNTLGMQMRGYFDFGVAMQDPRLIVKVKGEA